MTAPTDPGNDEPTQPLRALAVDDQKEVLVALRRVLTTRGFEVETHTDPHAALASFQQRAGELDLVITDMSMPIMDGIEFVKAARDITTDVPIVMLTGDNTAETAVDALAAGAFGYVLKSRLADPEAFVLQMRNAASYGQLGRRARQLEQRVAHAERFETLIGSSEPMRAMFATIAQVASLDVSVLALGESGTGKELVARAIHARSPRAGKPFVALNCAALPDNLVDSELFGHAKGAFTGAVGARDGAFRRADGGTLFLDEIGDVPPAVQLRLLRVLQEREVLPVGAESPVPVDVRVVAATLVDLEQAVEDKTFRPDLYYRLNVVSVELPPLRNRMDDVEILAGHFLAKHSERMGRELPRWSPEAIAALSRYHWPGNVRELENAVLRALALSAGDVVAAEALPERVLRAGSAPHHPPSAGTADEPFAWAAGLPMPEARKLAQERFERAYLARLLTEAKGNISEASRRAGVDRANLRRTMSRNGIKASDFS